MKNELNRLALAGALLVALLNIWLAAHALHTLLEAQRWQAHTLQVISATEGLVAKVRTTESAARGYILTGSPSFEQQYTGAVAELGPSIEDIRQLTGDNPSQQSRIVELRARVQAKVAALSAGVSVRRGHPSGALNPALLGPVISDTPDRTASVQRVINDIEVEERRVLRQRDVTIESARHEVWYTFTLAFALDLILLVAASQFLLRMQSDKQTLEARSSEIATLNAELQALNADLEERVEQRTRELAISNQELEAFSYSVSHDLRAPLRTIDGFSLALQEDFGEKLNDEGRDYIKRVRSGVQRMGTLIDALLQLSRVTRSDLQREDTDLSTLATLVFNEISQSDIDRKIEFATRPGIVANADPRLLRVAFENLLGNAWKFTARTPDARVEFGSSLRDGRTVYFVKDNGAGFDMKYVDRLFTAFQRLHGDREFKGSGIGLATVSRIIRRHDGSYWAESEVDHGATFFFTLGD